MALPRRLSINIEQRGIALVVKKKKRWATLTPLYFSLTNIFAGSRLGLVLFTQFLLSFQLRQDIATIV